MVRTRAAVLEGAARSVSEYGSRHATMADIATFGGIAKATLYNHFRRKPEVYAALISSEIRRVADECSVLAAADLGTALAFAAEQAATHPAVRRVAADEADVLGAMLTASDDDAWSLARAGVATVLSAAGRTAHDGHVDLVLRWVASHLAAPGTPETRVGGAATLAALTLL